ncbi:homocysteine S-methyltransferase [Xanthomonas vesicatoria]|uniref:S-methylmethionine:homocysteine methyltransferase n=1 Tax=Xanthomonas vesicatoria TaxID=56460 RepID=A0AAJ0N5F3_9XANT|nr:homocysteine S-methyltransferase [Xanthomonas vesicatoria]APO97037.1 homocysteine S-methyltransferase [Xanthomonas vesicatoria]KHM93606.1 homocysteine methyltransferase [Xanthomonas vesicatoria]KHM97562.1 homocysteine methyltransferase [Xanthomonas vesicatoria]MCC8621192.1 homocysteine S-methyltransferase [Xanthomonas vesicatoria]MCC8695491.1 homocysteine S-methyltransferase [Xanthomonas vesicatoria]
MTILPRQPRADAPFSAALQHEGYVLLDGALATELEQRGCDLNDALWSARVLMEQPELIYQVHRDYFAAGAQCAITASYQATPLGFAARGLDLAQSQALIARSATLAAQALADHLQAQPDAAPLWVAGSVGPYGAYLADGSEYRGDYALPLAQLMEFHRPRIAALAAAGVDVLACETLPSANEIVALRLLLEEFPQLHAWFSFTLRDADHLSDGTPLAQVIPALDAYAQVIAVGINCIALDRVTAALQRLSALTALPLVVYPNSGEHYDAGDKRWHGGNAPGCSLADQHTQWLAAGARLIGGCCRTTPRDIAALAAARAVG